MKSELRLKGKFFIIVFFFISISSIYGNTKQVDFYISSNIFSYFNMIRFKEDIVDYVFLAISDTEIGFSLNFGLDIEKFHTIEFRFSIGQNNKILFIDQYQFCYQIFPFRGTKMVIKNFYFGINIKVVNLHYVMTDVVFSNISPSFSIGYRFQINNLFFDLRINQIFGMLSFSNIKETSANWKWQFSPFPFISPVLPLIQLNIGWMF